MLTWVQCKSCSKSGADPGFQVRGRAHLKKLRRAERGAKIFGVFRAPVNVNLGIT
jgi:hypothetical protein